MSAPGYLGKPHPILTVFGLLWLIGMGVAVVVTVAGGIISATKNGSDE